jgi:hypothetical protein
MKGNIEEILICKEAGSDLYTIDKAELVPGKGIIGDRYFYKTGTFSKTLEEKGDYEVTLIESEEIRKFNKEAGSNFSSGSFRRNIVTSGVRLNELVGESFKVGSIELKGMRLCEPCAYLEKLLGKEVMKLMMHKAGLRATVKVGGFVGSGDEITKC